jgi:deferrochelatase/peroxidase EfeB
VSARVEVSVPWSTPLDLADIQGNILRGYGFGYARHFALGIGDTAEARASARAFIGSLLPGAPGEGPSVTTAEHWEAGKRWDCLNLGVTFDGLAALGVPQAALDAFPEAFREGPAARAAKPDPDFPRGVGLGDIGKSAPENWDLGRPGADAVHLMLSLYTRDADKGDKDPKPPPGKEHRETLSKRLRASFGKHQLKLIWHHDADALPDGRVHFGYPDGISQPRVGIGKELRDMQPMSQIGDFLLGAGHTNIYRGNYLGDIPAALGDNATYGAFRILEQDVFGFEDLLKELARIGRMKEEEVAAKLMGRWRTTGVPLTLSPDTDEAKPPVPRDLINEFDYGPGPDHPTYYDDSRGLRCPVGAHIRRLNPRGSRVMGMPNSRRIMRRAMPYGPGWKLGQPRKKAPRGLVGWFICGDLEMQFEFIQKVWVNQDLSTNGLRGTREPILGSQPKQDGRFTVRTADARDPIGLSGMPDLVTTRGSVYCMLPGIGGLRHLAELAPAAPGGAA